MDAPGAAYNPVDPNTPCAAGSRLHYDGGSETPSQNGDATWEAPFTCVIPRTAKGADEMATGMPGIYFGHGLLQNHRIVEQLGLFPASLEGVACGTDWIGLSAVDPITGDPYPGNDLTTYLLNMIGLKRDLSLFSALPDRSQQGYINALYLARAMAAPDGLGAEPEFEGPGGQSALDIDPDDTTAGLGYYGVSLGGIFGGATTAVAPDWERAVLSVPGMGFTTLLSRSTQFNQFLPAIYGAYPDELARQVGISALQLLWDRGEPSAYVHGILDGRFGAPEHQVMLHEAFGDHQVANVQTETLGRSLGAAVRTPTVTTERLNSREYLFSDVAKPFYTPAQALIDSTDLNVPGGFETNASRVHHRYRSDPSGPGRRRLRRHEPEPRLEHCPGRCHHDGGERRARPARARGDEPGRSAACNPLPARPGRLRRLRLGGAGPHGHAAVAGAVLGNAGTVQRTAAPRAGPGDVAGR